MSLCHMWSKARMVVKAPALLLWKPIVEAFLAHSFLQNKSKGWDFLLRVWFEVTSFQWHANIFSVILQGDQEHLFVFWVFFKAPNSCKLILFHPITIWFSCYDSKHSLQLVLFGSCKKIVFSVDGRLVAWCILNSLPTATLTKATRLLARPPQQLTASHHHSSEVASTYLPFSLLLLMSLNTPHHAQATAVWNVHHEHASRKSPLSQSEELKKSLAKPGGAQWGCSWCRQVRVFILLVQVHPPHPW